MGLSQYKNGLLKYGVFPYKNEMVVRQSYLYSWNSYIFKTESLYRDGPEVITGLS